MWRSVSDQGHPPLRFIPLSELFSFVVFSCCLSAEYSRLTSRFPDGLRVSYSMCDALCSTRYRPLSPWARQSYSLYFFCSDDFVMHFAFLFLTCMPNCSVCKLCLNSRSLCVQDDTGCGFVVVLFAFMQLWNMNWKMSGRCMENWSIETGNRHFWSSLVSFWFHMAGYFVCTYAAFVSGISQFPLNSRPRTAS